MSWGNMMVWQAAVLWRDVCPSCDGAEVEPLFMGCT